MSSKPSEGVAERALQGRSWGGVVQTCPEGPKPSEGLFKEAWNAPYPRKGLFEEAWKAPYPRKGLFDDLEYPIPSEGVV